MPVIGTLTITTPVTISATAPLAMELNEALAAARLRKVKRPILPDRPPASEQRPQVGRRQQLGIEAEEDRRARTASNDSGTEFDVRARPGEVVAGQVTPARPSASGTVPVPGNASSVKAPGSAKTDPNEKRRPFRIAFLGPPAARDLFGRHDWIRTNDPHHVKVVL